MSNASNCSNPLNPVLQFTRPPPSNLTIPSTWQLRPAAAEWKTMCQTPVCAVWVLPAHTHRKYTHGDTHRHAHTEKIHTPRKHTHRTHSLVAEWQLCSCFSAYYISSNEAEYIQIGMITFLMGVYVKSMSLKRSMWAVSWANMMAGYGA